MQIYCINKPHPKPAYRGKKTSLPAWPGGQRSQPQVQLDAGLGSTQGSFGHTPTSAADTGGRQAHGQLHGAGIGERPFKKRLIGLVTLLSPPWCGTLCHAQVPGATEHAHMHMYIHAYMQHTCTQHGHSVRAHTIQHMCTVQHTHVFMTRVCIVHMCVLVCAAHRTHLHVCVHDMHCACVCTI